MVSSDKTKINPHLKALEANIDSLFEDPDNARAHDERNLQAIKASLARFGQQKPIVATEAGMVIAGNGTLAAAKSLGWTRLAVSRFDNKNETAQMAYGIADNRTAELARWDIDVLENSLRHLSDVGEDLENTGFTSHEMEAIFGKSEWPLAEIDPENGSAKGYAEKLAVTIYEMNLRGDVRKRIEKMIEENGWQELVTVSA